MMIDLRSDTVTRPTQAMWDAMRSAPLGDDVLGDEPTVQALEYKVAQLLGQDAALFVPSGTMSNQLAIRTVCEGGDEILAHKESHIIHYETGSPAALSGCMIAPLEGEGGVFDAAAVRGAIRHRDQHAPLSRMLVVENTSNRGGGTIWSVEQCTAVAKAARVGGLHLHIDGARLMNACVALGVTPRDFTAQADSISLCFSKGLGAPVGSALVGPHAFIARARRFRKMFGGAMRQSGLLAAAAIYALDHHVARLADDHQNARALAAHIQKVSGLKLEGDAAKIPTNMVFFRVESALGTAQAFCDRLREAGVLALALGADRVRMVTHLDVSASDIDRAGETIGTVASSSKACA
ncbi:MAG: aminotransferase class I/II-fold pyridoxal phosphate-dependent enzyme [Phycisphaerales bacterium]|nr:aminotransferase class I/II-fold pyridoxal phosphate-dependent enzyme [Phycisphaerales bacterium]